MKGSPPSGQSFEQCTCLFTLLGRISGQMYDSYPFMANGLAGRLGIWKEHDWEIVDKEIWEGSLWIDFSFFFLNKTFFFF